VPHQLERQIAIDRLQRYSQQMRDVAGDHVSDVSETWNEDGVAQFSFRAMGMEVSGTTTVLDSVAEVLIRLPFAALPLRGLIEREVSQRLAAALEATP
jgi:hypothetical protein